MDFLKNFNLAGLEFQYVLGLLGLFVAVCLLITGSYYGLLEPALQRRRINQRLKGNKQEQQIRAQVLKAYQEESDSLVLNLAERFLKWGRVNSLQRYLLQADIFLSPNAFISVLILLALLGFMIGWLFKDFMWSVGLSFGFGLVPVILARWKRQRKTLKIEKYMPDAMELLARSLRAGHTLQGTLELAGQEIPKPLGTEMRVTYEEQRLGLSLQQAFRRMGERVACQDLRFFVTAVLIQSETGGNLAEILENIGLIIRDRLKLKGKVKGLTAEGRFSALILSLLPFVTFLAFYVVSPQYILTLFRDPFGIKLLSAGITSIIFGILIMKRMVNIKV
jgi:tight adherence protein B